MGNRNPQTQTPPHCPSPFAGLTSAVGGGAGALRDGGQGRVQVWDLVHAEGTVADGVPGMGQ
jgi:hypothetical protein